jgi:hypothetical protein
MRSIKFFAVPLLAVAFVLCGATAAIAGPVGGALLACNINDDDTRDLAYGGVAGTSQADFDLTTLIALGDVTGTGQVPTGGGVWDLVSCGRFGPSAAGMVSVGVSGTAANFVRVSTLNAAGDTIVASVFAPLGGGAWEYVGTADVDGDGLQDLILQGVDGTSGQPFAKVSIVVGANAPTTLYIGTANGLFDYVGKGDTDADGDEDLFFASNDGTYFRIDLADGTNPLQGNVKGAGGFSLAAIGDVNGDGKADMVLNSATTAKLQELDGATFMASIFRANGGGALVPILTGDTDDNGADDVLYNNSGSPNSTRIDLMAFGSLALLSNGFIDTGSFLPTVVGDFDGDDKADLAGQAPGATRLTLLDGTTATIGNFVNSSANYKVVN